MGIATQNSAEATAKMEDYKSKMSLVSAGVARREFEPLRSWPAKPHARQSEIDFLMRGIPSAYNK